MNNKNSRQYAKERLANGERVTCFCGAPAVCVKFGAPCCASCRDSENNDSRYKKVRQTLQTQ